MQPATVVATLSFIVCVAACSNDPESTRTPSERRTARALTFAGIAPMIRST